MHREASRNISLLSYTSILPDWDSLSTILICIVLRIVITVNLSDLVLSHPSFLVLRNNIHAVFDSEFIFRKMAHHQVTRPDKSVSAECGGPENPQLLLNAGVGERGMPASVLFPSSLTYPRFTILHSRWLYKQVSIICVRARWSTVIPWTTKVSQLALVHCRDYYITISRYLTTFFLVAKTLGPFQDCTSNQVSTWTYSPWT